MKTKPGALRSRSVKDYDRYAARTERASLTAVSLRACLSYERYGLSAPSANERERLLAGSDEQRKDALTNVFERQQLVVRRYKIASAVARRDVLLKGNDILPQNLVREAAHPWE